MRRSSQSPAKDSAVRRSARNSQQYVANVQGRSSTSDQEAFNTPRRSLRISQQNGINCEGQSSMSQQPTEYYDDDETNSRKNSVISPRIRRLLKELEETRRLRKYNVERESIRGSQQLAPGLEVMMNLGLVQDTRLTSVNQKLKYRAKSNYITSETEGESTEATESSEIAKTSETLEASDMITLEYPQPSETTTSEYPDTSEILESSEAPEKFYIPRRPEMPGAPKMLRRSVMPGRPDVPRRSVMPGRPDVPRRSVIPGGPGEPRRSIMPGKSDMPRCSMPGGPAVPRNSIMSGRSDMPRCSMMSGKSDTPRNSVIPERSDMSRTGRPRKSVIPGRSDMSRTDMPRTSGKSDIPRKSVISGRADVPKYDLPQKSIIPGRSGMPRTDMPEKSVIPRRSDICRTDTTRKSVLPRRSDMSGTDMFRKSVISGRSDISKTDMPRKSVIPGRSDVVRRSDMAQSSIMPERSEKWEEQSFVDSEDICYSDTDSTLSNTSDEPSDTSIHTRQSRVSRVGSILETIVIEERKKGPKNLRRTIEYAKDNRWSILNRLMANCDIEKTRYSEDMSTGKWRNYIDNSMINWNIVKDPRRKSIKPIQVDSESRVDSVLSECIGSRLHVAMARCDSQESIEPIDEEEGEEEEEKEEEVVEEEEVLFETPNWSTPSEESELSLLSETISDGKISKQEQERRLKELKEDLELEDSTPYQGEHIRFSLFKKKIIQEMPKTPRRKRKKGPRSTPQDEDVWLTQVPKVRQQVLSLDSEQSSLPNPDNALSMRGSALYRNKRAMRRNGSDYTEDTQEGKTSEIDETKRSGKPYLPSFSVIPPTWTHPNFCKNPENRSLLISTEIELIQRQQKTLSDIKKAQIRQSTISGSVNSSYGHDSTYTRQNSAHSPYSQTSISGEQVKTGFRRLMRILPEDFKDFLINDPELRDSVDFDLTSLTQSEDIDYFGSDMQWEGAIVDQRDSYSEMEDMIPERTDSYTEDEGTKSEQTDVNLETEIPVTTRGRTSAVPVIIVTSDTSAVPDVIVTSDPSPVPVIIVTSDTSTVPDIIVSPDTSAVPDKTVSSSKNENIAVQKILRIRKPTIPESEYNMRMKLVPAFAPRKKTVRIIHHPKFVTTMSARQIARAKSQKFKYETIRTTVAEMEREQNRRKPITGQKKTVPPKIKPKPATTTGTRPTCAPKNLDQQQGGGSATREQPKGSIDSKKAALRVSNIGAETTTCRRLSSSISPSRQQSGVVTDGSRFRLSTLQRNTLNRASGNIQPGEQRDSIANGLAKHPLEDLGPGFKSPVLPAVEESEIPICTPSEPAVPLRSSTSRRLSTVRDSISYPRDPTIQLVPGTVGTRTARGSISCPRDPSKQLVPGTSGTRTARGSISYPRDPSKQLVLGTTDTRTARGSISYPRDHPKQLAPANIGTRTARGSISYPRDPTIQLVPGTIGTRTARGSISYPRDPTIQLLPATVSTRSAGRSVTYLRDPTIPLEPVTPRKSSTSSARKTPSLNATIAPDIFNRTTALDKTIVEKKSSLIIKPPKKVFENKTIQKISEQSHEYASPKAVQQNIRCSDFTEKPSKQSLLNITNIKEDSPRKQTPVKGRNVEYTTAKINPLLNIAMIENKGPSRKEQHADTTADEYYVEPQQQTSNYSQDSITSETDLDTSTVKVSFYDFISKYHKQSHESVTSDEILNAEMANSQSPQLNAQGLNFLRLGVKFSDVTIPRQMYADLTKIMPNLEEATSSDIESISQSNMERFLRNSFALLRQIVKESPDSTVQPSETQAQPGKTPEPVATKSSQLGTTSAKRRDKYTQKTSTETAIKPGKTITEVIKRNETLPTLRRASVLPMTNIGNVATTPEASLASWIRERRTSHAIPIPTLVGQNPESLLPPKKRPIPEWRKDERPYRKFQSLIPDTDKHQVRTNTRRTLQNKVIALRRSKMGRQRRLAVPASTLNWRKFMRTSTVFANRSRKSMVRSKKFAKQYKKSLSDTGKPGSMPLIFRQFLIGHVIGQGSFGTVRIAENLFKEEPCAVKMEYISKRKLYLSIENRMYKRIGRAVGFAEVFHFEQFVFNKYNTLVMELLGPSLEEIYKKITRFSLKSVIQIIQQVLRRIEYIHQKGIIHRDIKPANLLVGRLGTRKQNMIYLVDFGMAKLYKNSRGKHIKYSPAAGRFGTAKYSSINAHLGREHSRRDDLEACGYMFIYFARGSLPWQGLDITNAKQRYKKIGELKQSTSLEKLCEGLPAEFTMYMKYVRRLKFSEDPDYSLLRNMFSELYFRKEYFNRREFDWTELLEKEPDPRLRQGLPGPKFSRPHLKQFYL